MPRFPGCEDLPTEQEKSDCSREKLLNFINDNLKYPVLAQENGLQGTTVVTFGVETDGTLSNIKVVRDIGCGCGEEAARVVALMNERGIRWTPGTQNGKEVRVQYNLPIRFGFPTKTGTAVPLAGKTDTPPPPAIPNPDTDVFRVVEQMPQFPGCEDLLTEQERKACSQSALLKFIFANLTLSSDAKEASMEGTTAISFIVEKDGTLSDIKVIRDMGCSLGAEVLRVVALMNERGIRWTPGVHYGKKVRVQYNVPIRIHLE